MFIKEILRSLLIVIVVCYTVVAQGINIDLVSIGNPNNPGELSGTNSGIERVCGSVGYNYQIGKYEVTAGQYTEFLNHKAKVADSYGLYNTYMSDPTNHQGCNIQRNGLGTEESPYVYSVAADWANRPVNYVSYWDAARFTNWLSNGQGNSDTETGAYTLGGYNGDDGRDIVRNSGAKWFIPTEDEWYKAAYHKNDGVTSNYWDYATQSDADSPPINTLLSTDPGNHANFSVIDDSNTYSYTIGSPYYRTEVGAFTNSASSYGTFDQGGNVWEWNDTLKFTTLSRRVVRGGSYGYALSHLLADSRDSSSPDIEGDTIGFRVASIPEPDSMMLLIAACVSALGYIWQRH